MEIIYGISERKLNYLIEGHVMFFPDMKIFLYPKKYDDHKFTAEMALRAGDLGLQIVYCKEYTQSDISVWGVGSPSPGISYPVIPPSPTSNGMSHKCMRLGESFMQDNVVPPVFHIPEALPVPPTMMGPGKN